MRSNGELESRLLLQTVEAGEAGKTEVRFELSTAGIGSSKSGALDLSSDMIEGLELVFGERAEDEDGGINSSESFAEDEQDEAKSAKARRGNKMHSRF